MRCAIPVNGGLRRNSNVSSSSTGSSKCLMSLVRNVLMTVQARRMPNNVIFPRPYLKGAWIVPLSMSPNRPDTSVRHELLAFLLHDHLSPLLNVRDSSGRRCFVGLDPHNAVSCMFSSISQARLV